MKSLSKKEIIKRYSRFEPIQDTPDSFYSWQETQVMMKGKKSNLSFCDLLRVDYELITSNKQLNKVLNPFQSASVIGIDCETTGLNPHIDKVRLIQLAIANHPVIIIDLFAIPITQLNPLQNIFNSTAFKVGHNLKFEWIMLQKLGFMLNPPLFDTYLAYRVLTTGLKKKLSLQAITHSLLGIKLDKTEQRSDFSGDLTSNQLQYAATDAAIVLSLYPILKEKLKKAQLHKTAKIEFDCLPSVAQMELYGMYLDAQKWRKMGEHLKEQQIELKKKLNQELKLPPSKQISLLPELTETINFRSPKQVKAALQAQNIPVNSTNAQDLIALVKEYPVIQMLLEYRSLSSRISTFAEGLLEHIHPITGRIHPNWFQLGARSGRFSCREPNLQNIPRDKETRQCFTSIPGTVLIKADYSQIELRIMAKVSGDKRMCQAYRLGEDLHRLTASFVFGKVLSDVTDEERRLGKMINFGLVYGMGASKFRNTAAKDYGVEMSLKQASEFRQKFFASYPGVKRYHQKVRKQWSQGVRESRTLGGRRRVWGKKHKPTLNEMINNPIQGTNCDITKLALALAYRCFEGTGVQFIAAIHDEIVLECPVEIAEWVRNKLKRCMVVAGNTLISPIPVEVEIQIVGSWGG